MNVHKEMVVRTLEKMRSKKVKCYFLLIYVEVRCAHDNACVVAGLNKFYRFGGTYLLIAMDMKRHVDCRLVRIALGPEAPSGASSRSTKSETYNN